MKTFDLLKNKMEKFEKCQENINSLKELVHKKNKQKFTSSWENEKESRNDFIIATENTHNSIDSQEKTKNTFEIKQPASIQNRFFKKSIKIELSTINSIPENSTTKN